MCTRSLRLNGVVAVRAEQPRGDVEQGSWPAGLTTSRTCVVQFHKPPGLVTSRAHQHEAETVYDYLQV